MAYPMVLSRLRSFFSLPYFEDYKPDYTPLSDSLFYTAGSVFLNLTIIMEG
jgi:hypothetical protein